MREVSASEAVGSAIAFSASHAPPDSALPRTARDYATLARATLRKIVTIEPVVQQPCFLSSNATCRPGLRSPSTDLDHYLARSRLGRPTRVTARACLRRSDAGRGRAGGW